MARQMKGCMKRLMKDLEELRKAPVENVSAVPLEDDMLEWHCNIRQGEIIFHLILFFPPEYPCKSPSAEFVPRGFNYGLGATKEGKKGTQICLNIFSDFGYIHTEWTSQKSDGWSPGYTVQMVLMNVVSFLAENQTTSGADYTRNLALSKPFVCSDCGHSYEKPFPSLAQSSDSKEENKEEENSCIERKEEIVLTETNVIIDYISKEKFDLRLDSQEDTLFGFGLVTKGTSGRAKLTTPCEFLTARSFYDMKNTMNVVHSVQKEEIKYFLPLFIHPRHGSHVRAEFEKTMESLSNGVVVPYGIVTCTEDMVLKTLPNLMCATVVEFFNGTQYTSENNLNGYFALHRLFLWALETYPTLQSKVEQAIKRFVENEASRKKTECPDIGQWLMLLSGSKMYRWQDVTSAYMQECGRRNVVWYIKKNPDLKDVGIDPQYRLDETFKLTVVSRNLLAFQVVFLDVAMPEGLNREQIIKRYDDNLGFPTQAMVDTMKSECRKIKTEVQCYADWYSILKVPIPSDKQIFEILVDAVSYAVNTNGYYWI